MFTVKKKKKKNMAATQPELFFDLHSNLIQNLILILIPNYAFQKSDDELKNVLLWRIFLIIQSLNASDIQSSANPWPWQIADLNLKM